MPYSGDTGEGQRRDAELFEKMTVEQRKNWAKQIVHRMMCAYNVSEKKGLAELIGCHQNMPSNWIQQGSVPWKVIYHCHVETGATLDWLYDGKEASVKITKHLRYKLESIALEVMHLADRLDQIEQTGDDGFKLASKNIAAYMIAILSPKSTESDTDNIWDLPS